MTTSAAVFVEALAAQSRIGDDGSLTSRREFARRVIVSLSLAKADKRCRWQPLDERLDVTWR